MSVTDLPAVNATLNATSADLLHFAYPAIRRNDVQRHRTLMLATSATSALILFSYLVYHAHFGSVKFTGTRQVRQERVIHAAAGRCPWQQNDIGSCAAGAKVKLA